MMCTCIKNKIIIGFIKTIHLWYIKSSVALSWDLNSRLWDHCCLLQSCWLTSLYSFGHKAKSEPWRPLRPWGLGMWPSWPLVQGNMFWVSFELERRSTQVSSVQGFGILVRLPCVRKLIHLWGKGPSLVLGHLSPGGQDMCHEWTPESLTSLCTQSFTMSIVN